jgi:PAS domain S-box-containing protein
VTNPPPNPDEALATRTRELEAVRAVTVEITQELDLPTLLALINRHAAELVGATASIIRLWDERAEVLIPVAWHGLGDWIRTEVRRLGESVSGTVAARREGLIVNDYQASPYAMPAILAQTTITAVMAEPLLYRERLLGVLVVDRYAGAPPFTEADAELLRLFAAQAAIAIENARLHEATAHHAAQLTNLTDLTQSVTAVLEPAALAQKILEAAQVLIPGAAGRLWEAGEDALRLVASIGLQDPTGGDRIRFLRGEGVAGLAVATRQPVICADVTSDPRFVNKVWAQAEGLVSSIVLPLVHRDQALGVFALFTRSPHVFSSDEVRLLSAFAAQAAIAMANARLYTAADGQRRQLEAVQAVTTEITRELEVTQVLHLILARARGLLDTRSGAVFLWDAAAQVLVPQVHVGLGAWYGDVRHPLGEGVVGAVAQRRAGLIVNDYPTSPYVVEELQHRTGVQRAVCAPLLYRDRLIGVLILRDKQSGAPFQETDLDILCLFADQAAIALENARLFTELTQSLQELLQEGARRQQAEDDLRASRALLQAVVEGTSDAVFVKDLQGRYLLFNAAAERFTGTRAAETLGHDDRVLFPPAEAATVMAGDRAVLEGGKITTTEDVLTDAAGAHHTFLSTKGPMVDAAGQPIGLFGILRDITERKRVEVALRDRTAQLEAVQAVTTEIIRELDLDRLLTLLTQRVTKLLGVPTAVVRLWNDASGLLMPLGWTSEDGSEIMRLPFRLGEGVAGAAALRRTGLLVNDFRTSPYATPALLADAHTAVLAEPLLYHDRLVGVLSVDNGTTGRPFTPDDQALLRLFAAQAAIAIENARLFTEVTQSFQNLQKAQAALVQTEKLRALGQMVGGIAHDLNNKLMVILGQSELLRLTAAHPALEQALAPLEAAATASIAVVRQIMDFGRQHANVPHTPIALAAVVQEALALTRAQWKDAAERQGSPITIHTALADLPPVLGQAAELREALVQLIGNAVEAMPTGGTLTIAGRVVPATDDGRRGTNDGGRGTGDGLLSSVPGRWVELTVTDTGVGIPTEIQPDLFDPFFTTKGVQRTGLGLAVVYGTAQRHGGSISVASAPGQETTFTLRLPAAVAVQTAAPPAPAPARAGVTPRRLLLIDDEPKVRGTLASLLRAAGHTVTEAASGPAGLALLGTIPVDCVLTDLGMPEMTGWEVVKAVNASWPHLPVLLLTGWEDQEADVPPGHRVARVLSKPIRREPLLVVIAEVTRGL